MSRRAKSSSHTVVLEVSPRVAKVMMVSGSPLQIERVHAHALPEQTEDPTAALRALLAAQPLGTRAVGVLIGREAFSLRTLELPSTDAKEIASMLDLQLGKLTPYPRAEILSAWTVVGSFREGYTSVLLAIARKALVHSVLQFLKTKGVAAQWVGVSTEGLGSWWTLMATQGKVAQAPPVTALIDIDATSTDCAIFSDGRLVFTHSIAIGYEQLTTAEQATLRWVGELVRLPRILLHEDVKGQIGRGAITGLTQGLQPVVEQLASQWGVVVDVLDALAPCAAAATVRQNALTGRVSYTALVGVCASGKVPRIDLIPQETRVSQALGVRSKHLARLAGSLAAILLLATMLYVERIMMLRHYLTQLQQRLASLEQTSQQIIERKHAMERIQEWLDPSRSALEALRAVASAASEGIAVTQVSFTEEAPMKIRGTADAVRTPYEFVARLKQQPSTVTKSGCYVANAKGTGSRGAEFEVVCGKSES